MKKKIVKILKAIEPYYIALSYIFIGFFICITGIQLLPGLVERVGKESYTPLYYSISIIFGFMYFMCYKPLKVILREDKE